MNLTIILLNICIIYLVYLIIRENIKLNKLEKKIGKVNE